MKLFITQKSHETFCDRIWPEHPIVENQRLFVKTDFLIDYIRYSDYFPSHVLVTGNSDFSPSTFLTDDQIDNLLNRDNIISWYSQNVIKIHPKLFHLPIGLEDTPEKLSFFSKYGDDLRAIPKINNVYTNFNIDTNIHERSCFFKTNTNIPFEDYMKTMATYKYVLCPMGNGVDTHRFWEAQVCGCIPIIRCPKEFLATYYNVNYISIPGVCYARLGHPNIIRAMESIFVQNTPSISIIPLIENHPLFR